MNPNQPINWQDAWAELMARQRSKESTQTMDTTSYSTPVEFKSQDVTPDGRFWGYASTFGNLDGNGDIVEPGAFSKTLAYAKSLLYRATGGRLGGSLWPIYWQHDEKQRIGSIIEAHEDDHGLYVTGQLDLSSQYGPVAYEAMKAGALKTMSIGYHATNAVRDRAAGVGKGIRRLMEIALHEVSVVWNPANVEAQVLEVKSLGGLPDYFYDRSITLLARLNLLAEDELAAIVNNELGKTLSAQQMDLKMMERRKELGDEEIERRGQAALDNLSRGVKELAAYRRERKARRSPYEPPPPNPARDPDGYRKWEYERRWKEMNP